MPGKNCQTVYPLDFPLFCEEKENIIYGFCKGSLNQLSQD